MTPNLLANQLRAARAWLNWSREDLAEKAGVVANTIAAIEKGDGSSEPNARTMGKIISAIEAAGVEFTDEGGVRPRVSRVTYFTGEEGFHEFFNDVYESLKKTSDPDVCIANADESLFEKWHKKYDAMHTARIADLKLPPYKVLLREDDFKSRISLGYCDYRRVSSNLFADICVYIYAEKTAFVDFGHNTVTVTVVDSRKVSEALRRMFYVTWDSGEPVELVDA